MSTLARSYVQAGFVAICNGDLPLARHSYLSAFHVFQGNGKYIEAQEALKRYSEYSLILEKQIQDWLESLCRNGEITKAKNLAKLDLRALEVCYTRESNQ